MATLAQVTKNSRGILKIGAITLGILFFIYIGFQGYNFFKVIFQPPPPPVQGFGKLPNILFPATGHNGIELNINTVDGKLPNLSDRAFVYKILQNETGLLALEEAKRTLSSAGFDSNQIKITDTLYQWTNPSNGIIIQYDINSKNFTVSSNYLTNPNLESKILIPDKQDVMSGVQTFLSNLSIPTDDIDFENSSVMLLEPGPNGLVEAQNLANAKFAKVNLVQKPVNNLPFIYDQPNDSVMSFIVSYPSFGRMQVVEAVFFHQIPNLDEKSDYPIKSATQAFEDLKSGNAYVVNPDNQNFVDITNVQLMYYLGKNPVEYLQPVIVFSGTNFAGYVEAVVDSTPSATVQ